MVKQECIDQLVGVQGYTVKALHFGEGRGSGEKELVVEIERLGPGTAVAAGQNSTPTTTGPCA